MCIEITHTPKGILLYMKVSSNIYHSSYLGLVQYQAYNINAAVGIKSPLTALTLGTQIAKQTAGKKWSQDLFRKPNFSRLQMEISLHDVSRKLVRRMMFFHQAVPVHFIPQVYELTVG